MLQRRLILKLLLVCCVILRSGLATAREDATTDPLERQISNEWSYRSLDEAIHQIEQKTGFRVSCVKELQTFMQTIWMKHNSVVDQTSTTSIKMFLDQVVGLIALKWQFDPKTEVITLNLPWQTSDPRTPAELLRAVWQPGYWTEYEKDPKWQTAFNALLSKEANFEKAWKVREKSVFQRVIRFIDDESSKPILMKEIVAASGEKYVLILVSQDIQMYPGNGSVSYYWFKHEGTLVGAGLMNTGHRCKLVDTTIDNEYGPNADNTSELQMILKMNLRDFFIARFVLDGDAFKLTHLVDGHGKDVSNNGLNVGQSLMEPDKQ